ncbi:FKBP-type peptidyl-prolyl cis-trans isomerase FklB [Dysgonomonas sp. PH5-45]|uniref:FKBP-type peptidyl-prolyl cis-trans isomerase n=1 Tax=unclassified Dysgonomonas TaxID=2630389 RepID=UPI00247691C7|nr:MULTISPECIES: FKBP-type peptidyl-prolyl cis-trans isomerase [unclassified Dysgonomonas]MDH6353850.1 FKBP-type peptidyl-prolyl cis-trans isomerase FklB [Dysgonomonas sp. PH5-45]MDH6386752.1 FKBP-type peptidyl-prolyl cis-trans isomerase FklB [Dysgonomonas sp. PH5-37]
MKKIQVLALSAVVALGAAFTSCNSDGSSAGNASLKTDVDTLSYAMGVSVTQGLTEYLQQLGVLADTAMLKMIHQSMIEAEKDATKKAELEKDFKFRLDSVVSANKKNLADFKKGLSEVFSKSDNNSYKAGLSVGIQIAQMMEGTEKQLFADDDKQKLNKKAFLSGFFASVDGKKLAMENPQAIFQAKMNDLQDKAKESEKASQQQQEEALLAQYGENKAAGEKFLEENKTKDGVKTLPSGVQYKVITAGKGEKPTATNVVKVNYKGSLIDGTVFESSFESGKPAIFPVNQVIPGWTEILQQMPVGSKWMVFIPQNLAYGSGGAGEMIKPFSTLIFEIELLNIEQ